MIIIQFITYIVHQRSMTRVICGNRGPHQREPEVGCRIMKRASPSACNGIYYENCRRRNYERWRPLFDSKGARGDSNYAHRCGFAPKDNTFGKLHSRTAEETSRANSSDFITSKPRGKEYRGLAEALPSLRRWHFSPFHDIIKVRTLSVFEYHEFLWTLHD